MAIRVCCIDAIRNNKNGRINIYSDSIGALNALKNYRIDTNQVTIYWIPARFGIYGHTQADSLAKAAAKMNIYAPLHLTTISRSYCKTVKDEWLEQTTRTKWRQTQIGEHTKCFLNDIKPNISNQLLCLNKRNMRIAIDLITGHCKVNSHLAELRIRDDPDCDLCGSTRETAIHSVCTCESLQTTRNSIYGSPTMQAQEITNRPIKQLINFYLHGCETNISLKRIFNI